MQETKRIALLFDPSIGYCRDVLEGIQSHAENRPGWTFHEAEATMSSLRPLLEWRPHGVLAYLAEENFTDELMQHGIPTVNTTSTLEKFEIPLVEVDHKQVGEMAAAFFLDRGYRRFGFFGSARTHVSQSRESAFRSILTNQGYDCFTNYEEDIPQESNSGCWTATDENVESWLRQLTDSEHPTALLAVDDETARYITRLCKKLHISIPEELALLSVNNNGFDCRLANPTLSSIEIPSFEIGRRAADLLSRMMNGETAPESPCWLAPIRVVVRESTDFTAVSDEEVRRFFFWLNDNFSELLKTDDLCESIGVGRRTLERKLKTLLGTTIHREIRKRRLAEAAKLLVSTSSSITSVANESGFTSSERLAIVFGQEFKMSPSQYRDKYGFNNIGREK